MVLPLLHACSEECSHQGILRTCSQMQQLILRCMHTKKERNCKQILKLVNSIWLASASTPGFLLICQGFLSLNCTCLSTDLV